MSRDGSGVTAASAVQLRVLGQIELKATAGGDVDAVLSHRKRLALFIYLALVGPRAPRGREALMSLFWPESPTDAARHSLREALRFLRRALGADLILTRAGDEVELDRGLLSTDVGDFERAVSDRRYDDAIALYRGPLLEGFSVSGASSEFEHWLDVERARLHALAMRASAALTDAAEQAGNLPLAVRAARDQLRFAPFDEPSFRRLMTLLERSGDKAGALRAYDAFVSLMARELDTTPSPETRGLAVRLRAGVGDKELDAAGTTDARVQRTERVDDVDASASARRMDAPGPKPASPLPRLSRRLVAATVILAAAVVTAMTFARVGHGSAPRELLAVGAIRVQSNDTLLTPGLVRQLVAADLARIDGIDVVSGERIAELLATSGAARDTGQALATAARRAGATQVLEGMVTSTPTGTLRIDVQRVGLSSGTIRGAHTIEARDVFSLADRLSDEIAGELGHHFPRIPLAELTSTSLVARRFYEEGVRSYYEGDRVGALRLLEAALREDSTFTMAAYYGAWAGQLVRGDTAALRLMAQALRLSRRAPERERLIVGTAWAFMSNNPSLVTMAESLATRFPLEADGDFWLGSGFAWSGDRAQAIVHLRRAIDRDSSMFAAEPRGAGASPSCRACDALANLVLAYEQSDSLAAAERVSREWIRRQSASYAGWVALAGVYEQEGRITDARAAFDEASQRAGRDLTDAIVRARLAIRESDFATADRLLTDQVAAGAPDVRADAQWWLELSLRQQGRVREALAVTERDLRARSRVVDARIDLQSGELARAQALFELGRFTESAVVFDSLASIPQTYDALGLPELQALSARHRVWMMTLAATAYAAAGDTGRLARLADSVEHLGALEAYGRDRRLHLYVRGLLLESRGDNAGAAAAFQQAMYSPTVGYTRVNLELARVLLALGRPKEAVATLQSALRGTLEGSNFYVTRTELHETLGAAYAAADQRDSARAQYALVARAWRGADASFQARRARALRQSVADGAR